MTDITNNSKKRTYSTTLLLAARIIGTIWVVVCLFGVISFFLEGNRQHARAAPESPDILAIATVVCFLVAFCGLIIAWWRAGIGGFISLFGFIITGVLFKYNPNLMFSLPFYFVILLPSILYLAYWREVKKSSDEDSKS